MKLLIELDATNVNVETYRHALNVIKETIERAGWMDSALGVGDTLFLRDVNHNVLGEINVTSEDSTADEKHRFTRL